MKMFETERLRVRHLSSADFDALYAVYGDAEAMRFANDGQPLSPDKCREWIEVTERNYQARGYGMSAVVLAETNSVVGFCGLVHPGGQPEVEIKYAFLRATWGRGLATEAVCGMLAYGVERFGLRDVIGTVAPGNAASQRVLTKAGMSLQENHAEDDGSETAVFVWHHDEG